MIHVLKPISRLKKGVVLTIPNKSVCILNASAVC